MSPESRPEPHDSEVRKERDERGVKYHLPVRPDAILHAARVSRRGGFAFRQQHGADHSADLAHLTIDEERSWSASVRRRMKEVRDTLCDGSDYTRSSSGD
jgi:hypothetical protein